MISKEKLTEYAKQELTISGLINTDFGKNCILLLDSLIDISNSDPSVMKELCNIFPRLIDKMPITPITEEDFLIDPDPEGEIRAICIRYRHIYKHINGKYYNNRAKAFVYADDKLDNKIYTSKSIQEITLPYIPVEQIEVIES